MLGSPVSAWTNPEMATGVRMVAGVRVQQRVVAHRVQEAVNSTPPTPATLMPDAEWLTETCNDLDEGHNDGGAGSEPQEPHLPVGPTASLDPDQDSLTPRQRALHVARQRLQIARTSIESFQIVQTLAVALGAIHVEGGTIKALLAVLLQMDRPGMSQKEASPPREPRCRAFRSGERGCSTLDSTFLRRLDAAPQRVRTVSAPQATSREPKQPMRRMPPCVVVLSPPGDLRCYI